MSTMEMLRTATPVATSAATRFDVGDVERTQGRKILRNVVVAELGPFKDGRGQFNAQSLRTAANLMQATPLAARFGHPSQFDDGVANVVGEWQNARFEASKLKADLLFSSIARNLPGWGDVQSYVLTLAREMPWALNVSLVVAAEQIPQRRGEPRLWLPVRIQGADLVAVGAATNSLLGDDQRSVKQQNAEEVARRTAHVGKLLAEIRGDDPPPQRTSRAELDEMVARILEK